MYWFFQASAVTEEATVKLKLVALVQETFTVPFWVWPTQNILAVVPFIPDCSPDDRLATRVRTVGLAAVLFLMTRSTPLARRTTRFAYWSTAGVPVGSAR